MMTMKQIQEAVRRNELAKGFDDDVNDQNVVAAKIALIHSEASEALEDLRKGDMKTRFEENGKPVGFPSELADIVIRTMTLAEALGIDLYEEIMLKHGYNLTRPIKHGKKF